MARGVNDASPVAPELRGVIPSNLWSLPVPVRPAIVLTVLACAPLPQAARAQSPESGPPPAARPAAPSGVYLTVFRSPATGVEVRRGWAAVHAGHYPTVLKAPGQAKRENTNFLRVGAAAYLRPSGWSPYVAPALLVSLDRDWTSGVLSEAGVRVPVGGRAAARVGVGVLTTFDGETRVNPTVGLDVRLGRRR